ncbi:MAG: hypothetical protein JNM94_03235 [Phycisphaerae bacterium]|nr:hypothetical protein [Phycisphaerae bacterium]
MLDQWSGFFTLTGAAGATLVGLLFVVVTLNTSLTTSRTLDIAHASMTPALYSFTDVLLQGMVVLAPWQTDWPRGLLLVLLGIGGLVYRLNRILVRRTLHLVAIQRRVDRIFHNAAPVVASVAAVAGGIGLMVGAPFAPFAVAGSSAILLVSGIYRTWGETLALISTRTS